MHSCNTLIRFSADARQAIHILQWQRIWQRQMLFQSWANWFATQQAESQAPPMFQQQLHAIANVCTNSAIEVKRFYAELHDCLYQTKHTIV